MRTVERGDGQDISATQPEIRAHLRHLGHDIPAGTIRRWISTGKLTRYGDGWSIIDAEEMATRRANYLTRLTRSEHDLT
jgi:hypothetical protein